MNTRLSRSALPNALSLARLVLGLVFPWQPVAWRGWIVALAALTDLLDGASSRYLHATSTVGRLLDPLADKVFVAALVATLIVENTISIAEAVLVGLRDVTVLAGLIWMVVRGRGSDIPRLTPTFLGKLVTAAQFVFLLTVVVFQEKFTAIYVVTVVLSALAAMDYVRVYRHISKSPPCGSDSEAAGLT